MIGALRGVVESKSPGQVLVDVGGVVYEVAVSLQSYARLPAPGERVRLDVVTHLREDALVLFGFLDGEEKETFNWLRTVSGVGPRLALNILSGMPARDLRSALAAGDVDRLCRVPGVGKKTSERLVLELRERSREYAAASAATNGEPPAGSRDAEAISALVNLGYRRGEAERVLRGIAPDVRLEDAIREALRRFAR
ncbi:MAG TPA: Holliday junction branch migration protein RuvA [Candidatus Binatia bacterium]|nr:Holliday junction branch migration protein RuvA [Candidatus Binatia bacterium]